MAVSDVIVVKLASDRSPSQPTSTSPAAVDAIAGWANEGRRVRRWTRLLPAITGVAATLILAAVALRLWLADVRGGELLAWAAAILVLAGLAYLSQHVLDRRVALQAERQASLLQAISDIGEGLVITENGRYIAGNAAYQALTGYSSAELAEFQSLIELAPT